MNKTALCIKMLEILYSRSLVSISELAEMLETNPRNIPEYKKELEYAGYQITSVPGRYGGYHLEKDSLFPAIKLDAAEQTALLEGYDYLRSRGDFMKKRELASAMAKFASATSRSAEISPTTVIDKRPLAMPESEIKLRYDAVEKCIKERRVLELRYLTSYNVVKKRIIHPYKLFMMNNAWFTLAYCAYPNKGLSQFLIYKLNRIIDFNITKEVFRISLLYNENDFFDESGLKHGGDWHQYNNDERHNWYHIKLKLTGRPAMTVKEYINGKNQKITAVGSNTTILECDMEYRYNTIQFVLGFGSDCKVIEPEWLKAEVKAEAKKLLDFYTDSD